MEGSLGGIGYRGRLRQEYVEVYACKLYGSLVGDDSTLWSVKVRVRWEKGLMGYIEKSEDGGVDFFSFDSVWKLTSDYNIDLRFRVAPEYCNE